MEISDITLGAIDGRATRVTGVFRADSGQAFARLSPLLREQGRTLSMRREDDMAVLTILNGIVVPTPNNKWLPIVLAALTVISMLVTYTLTWEAGEFTWAAIGGGLAILVSHELGHYFMARHHGVAVTLPYLIPFPLSPFGTMGAVIRMKDVAPSRKAELMIGAAGPLVGLVVAIPLLLLGLSLSELGELPTTGAYVLEGNSLLYGALKMVIFGKWLPSGNLDVMLHPVAFAGWAGLLVTSFNLIPAGQLDGGHVARALLGDRARYLNWTLVVLVACMGLVWQGWFIWAAMIFFFSRQDAPPLDDLTPLGSEGRVVAILIFVLFVLTFTPIPLQVLG